MLQQRQFSDYIQPQGGERLLRELRVDNSCTCMLEEAGALGGVQAGEAHDKCRQCPLQPGGRNPGHDRHINKETWKFRCVVNASSMPTEHPTPNTSCTDDDRTETA